MRTRLSHALPMLAVLICVLAATVNAGERLSSEEKEARSQAISQEFGAAFVGHWEWSAYKAKFMGDRSESLVEVKGSNPHGEVTFGEDLQYAFSVKNPPDTKRALDAKGTYRISDGHLVELGQWKGLKSVHLELSAATPKDRLTRAFTGGGLVQYLGAKSKTAEETWVAMVDNDTLEMSLANLGEWLGNKDQAYLVLNRTKLEPATTPPAAQPPAPTVQIAVGMTEAEVITSAGEPQAKALLGEKTIYRYPTMIVTFVAGKVTDVSFR